ncbi:class F sortase [Pseudarthrobacter cellobiosi]|uniref:class F sortase n=1 Tax=Pseudarthrobacter cellobiosi TaxID=2953654 RepID=UPI00208FD876|nr:class F sortase [Pseudarthrobacter sp. HLT1-5]MCO4254465.1 class F sortase [Pseudarthrobacter sp. HLT1-5]
MAKRAGRPGIREGILHVLRGRALNRGDLAILLCGVLGFLSLTFGGPLLNHGEAGVPAGELSAQSPATPSSVQGPLAATGRAQAAAPEAAAPGPAAAAAPVPSLPEASAPLRILYPAADIDVPVHPLEPDASAVASRTLVPPPTMDGYWLTPFGTPGSGSDNTTYVIGHSWEGRDAPFNHLSSAAAVGDVFDVVTSTGSIRYRVDSVTTYLKEGLKDSPIWDMVPSRVVLISCYTEDLWGKNVVVSASPIA